MLKVYFGEQKIGRTQVSMTFSKFQRGVASVKVQCIPTAVNIGFLDRSCYFFIQVAPQLSSRGRVDPIPEPLLLRKSGRAGNRTQDLWNCSQKLWPQRRSMWLPSFHKTQEGVKRMKIQWCHHVSSKIAGCTCQVSNNWLQDMLQTVVWSLGSLYKVPRRLLWRQQYTSEGMCCYGEINSVSKLRDCNPHLLGKESHSPEIL
jgi:hypothetical protein